MKLPANAALSLNQRRRMARRALEQGWTLTSAARAAGVSGRPAAKWVARYRAEGEAGLVDRSSAAHRVANRTGEERIQAIAALRRLRMSGAEIALCLGMAPSTVSGLLRRIGLGTLARLEPPEPANRYQRRRPGELVHVDVKKLGAIVLAGHRVTGERRPRARGAPAGSTSTSVWTTPPAWPTWRSSPMSAPRARSAS